MQTHPEITVTMQSPTGNNRKPTVTLQSPPGTIQNSSLGTPPWAGGSIPLHIISLLPQAVRPPHTPTPRSIGGKRSSAFECPPPSGAVLSFVPLPHARGAVTPRLSIVCVWVGFGGGGGAGAIPGAGMPPLKSSGMPLADHRGGVPIIRRGSEPALSAVSDLRSSSVSTGRTSGTST